MPSVTQFQSKLQELCCRSNSMPGNFSNLDPVDSCLSENLLDNLLDDLALETHLAQHPAHKLIDLLKHHKFYSANKFCRIVAANRVHVLHSLTRVIEYDVTVHKKITRHYAE